MLNLSGQTIRTEEDNNLGENGNSVEKGGEKGEEATRLEWALVVAEGRADMMGL